MIVFVIIIAVFFAMNMGGASYAASFAAAYGGRVVSQKLSGLLFLIFVILGALVLGENVSQTLGNDIIPSQLFNHASICVIFLSAGLSMFVSNIMKIPQSTSIVTVAAIAGVGVYYQQINIHTIIYFLPFWLLLPVFSYFLTKVLAGVVYPPRRKNLWIYERLVNQQKNLKIFVIVASCYNAFSVGTNNVANVVGPLIRDSSISLFHLLLIFAIVYGSGAFVFTGPIKTAGHKIVPMGLLTASIIALVSGTLMIVASMLGVPQSFVMLKMGAVFAISSLKHGETVTFANPITQKMLYTWTINPVITFFFSYGLAVLILG